MALHIVPLTPERIPDLATLFDQGGDPKWCWCTFFRARGRDWTNSTAADNRAVLERAALTQGHAPGLVGYDGEAAVGWVSLGPREDFERLGASRVLAPLDAANAVRVAGASGHEHIKPLPRGRQRPEPTR